MNSVTTPAVSATPPAPGIPDIDAKTEALIQLKLYEAQGWIMDVDALADQVVFWIDPENKNRLLYKMPIKVIGNLIRLDGQIQTEY